MIKNDAMDKTRFFLTPQCVTNTKKVMRLFLTLPHIRLECWGIKDAPPSTHLFH